MANLIANSVNTDQMLHISASNLGLHCLPVTLLGAFRLQWVNNRVIKSRLGRLTPNIRPVAAYFHHSFTFVM